MKTITIWQPWASLLACGAKQYETRSWATNYRGEIAIHAAAKDFRTLYTTGYVVNNGILPLELLVRGCVIATAKLIGCWKIGRSEVLEPCIYKKDGVYSLTDNELLFGDWTSGRYAWEFTNMKMLDEPIPAKGKQRLWEWSGEDE